jgi:hypothetical protein
MNSSEDKDFTDGNWAATCLVIAALLFAAPLDLPYGYYTFLRWAVSLMSVAAAFRLQAPLGLTFGAIAILYNPLIIVGLSKATWTPINIVVGFIFLVALPKLKEDKKSS